LDLRGKLKNRREETFPIGGRVKGVLKRVEATPISRWLAGWTVAKNTAGRTMGLSFSKLNASNFNGLATHLIGRSIFKKE
jgi:hypothetical protein